MSDESKVDNLFKKGLSEMGFSGKEKMWQKLKLQLDEKKPSKRIPLIYFFLLLGFIFIGAQFFFTKNADNKLVSNETITAEIYNKAESKITNNTPKNILISNSFSSKKIHHFESVENKQLQNKEILSGRKKISIYNSGISEIETAAANISVEKILSSWSVRTPTTAEEISEIENEVGNISAEKTLSSSSVRTPTTADSPEFFPHQPATILNALVNRSAEKIPMNVEKISYKKSERKGNSNLSQFLRSQAVNKMIAKEKQSMPKFSLEVVAGSDILNVKTSLGYFAGLRLNYRFNTLASISFGVNYSLNNISESYRLSSKPAQQQQPDVDLNSITMLRFPIMLKQQFAKTKFSVLAGLTPVCILGASVYNVPNSFTGNPNLYRKFTIDDIHRLNVLFNAGIQYKIMPRLSVEINGSYGLTEMVKNSYTNQSRVNGNFRNVQVGVAYTLK